ncbi:8-oxoguanine DNA glycosylase OGG fold protein [Lentzea sp. DG1S-22]|uniref:8-oxoguanine DNA glycosylase OGG fold protein n=1 Tax=Lentzea sp. DG1S-22 TaxID=3108822 RepID=UPI003FA58A96
MVGSGSRDRVVRVTATRWCGVTWLGRERCGWTSLHREGPWPAETYERYCGLLARWAREVDRAPDEIERRLFAGDKPSL